jgi:hypothetical protein
VLNEEFYIFTSLDFNLHLPREEYMPHLERLVFGLDYNNLQEYISGKPVPALSPAS